MGTGIVREFGQDICLHGKVILSSSPTGDPFPALFDGSMGENKDGAVGILALESWIGKHDSYFGHSLFCPGR